MKIILVGYGRMGHELAAALGRRGHELLASVDPASREATHRDLSSAPLAEADGVIEFSLAEAVAANAAVYLEARLPAVVGTTGWEADLPRVVEMFENAEVGYMVGANFSIGANLFMRLAEEAARLINGIDDYDPMLLEYHHAGKADSPSGTALRTAEAVLAALDRKSSIQTEALHRQITPEELHVASVRGGAIPGTHTLTLDSAADTVEITHRARGRAGFADGAVRALEWLRGHKGYYTVDDFLTHLMNR
ncbi:MAG: 4-hydroxy-tetrahydrodipicolinate reductase [Alkalispirochaetaceae bacterium]